MKDTETALYLPIRENILNVVTTCTFASTFIDNSFLLSKSALTASDASSCREWQRMFCFF